MVKRWRREYLVDRSLTPEDAVFGFIAWLTTRKEEISFGSSHNCSPAVDAVKEWIEANGLDNVSEFYPDNLKFPERKS